MSERPLLALAVICAVLLSHCVLTVPGVMLRVDVSAAPAEVVVDASSRRWTVVALSLREVVIEPIRCPGEAAAQWGASTARPHVSGGAGSLAIDEVDLLRDAVAGAIEPVPASYCDLRVSARAIEVQLRAGDELVRMQSDQPREAVLRLRDGADEPTGLSLDATNREAALSLRSESAALFEDIVVADFDPVADGARLSARVLGALRVSVSEGD